jgi:hypothetical protein
MLHIRFAESVHGLPVVLGRNNVYFHKENQGSGICNGDAICFQSGTKVV